MSADPSQQPQYGEALLRSILESSLDGVMALRAIRNAEGRIVDFEWILTNNRAADLLGRTPDALIGSTLLKEMPGHATEGLFDHYVSVVETGEPFDVEHYHEHERAHSWFHTAAVRLGDGIALTFADISDRKRLEEQLLQSQKMEIIGRLAGGVAHDFNNLLTAISMNAEMALETLESSALGRPEVEGVLDGVRRATALTQQLLAFARRQTVSPLVVTVNDLVLHSAPMLRRLLGAGIELVMASSGEQWAVFVDPVKFEQVLTNLAVNAHDAMPRGGKFSLDISNVAVKQGDAGAIRHAPPGEYIRIDAEDIGTGMSPDVLPAHFRTVLHDKELGNGNRARVGNELRHRPPGERIDVGNEYRRPRLDVHDPPAARSRAPRGVAENERAGTSRARDRARPHCRRRAVRAHRRCAYARATRLPHRVRRARR